MYCHYNLTVIEKNKLRIEPITRRKIIIFVELEFYVMTYVESESKKKNVLTYYNGDCIGSTYFFEFEYVDTLMVLLIFYRGYKMRYILSYNMYHIIDAKKITKGWK